MKAPSREPDASLGPAAAEQDKYQLRIITASQTILVGAVVVCALVLIYFFYYYSWTRQRQFESWAGVLLYYVLPATLAIALAASLRLRSSAKVSLALLLCSASVCGFILEILLSVWFSLPSVIADQSRKAMAKAAHAAGVEFDTRSKLAVVHDLQGQGTDAVPSVFAAAFFGKQDDGSVKSPLTVNGTELMPIAGLANKTVVLCNESGRYLAFRSDSHGFNNPPNVWNSGLVDIAVVGDSYVQGYCVENNFVNLIRRRYPATLNLGIEGNGPLVMLATLKEYAAPVKPKVVLWCYYEGNDLSDLYTERKSALLRRYLTAGFNQGLITRQDEIDRLLLGYVQAIENKSDLRSKLEELWDLANAPQLRDLRQLQNRLEGVIKLTQVRQRLGLVYGTENQSKQRATAGSATSSGERAEWLRAQVDLSYDILVEAKRSVEEWGGRLYFVFLPQYYRYAPDFPASPDRDQVLSVVNRAALPVIDIHESFKSQADPLALFPLRLAGHYNEEGNRLVAEQVLRSISASN